MARVFEDIIQYPEDHAHRMYDSLVGLDDIKKRLVKEAEILLKPTLLVEWSMQKHGRVIPLVKLFENRHSLFIFSGDIGTGKTSLAETFGDQLARQNNIFIDLFCLSIKTRGAGATGEMTQFISQAFMEIKTFTDQLRNPDGTFSSACILFIDEADALAQSRDLEQMHHEDRAGVDALIQGIDSFTKNHLPVITVMCTNRLSAIDPAIKRRAAVIFEFHRPTAERRKMIFKTYLEGLEISDEDLTNLANITGETENRNYGYTYSDLIGKVLPAIILETFPTEQITLTKITEIIGKISPTPPLKEQKIIY
jgi:SpoVK/Ycf46/Vps4 family AAA+-type ATPase